MFLAQIQGQHNWRFQTYRNHSNNGNINISHVYYLYFISADNKRKYMFLSTCSELTLRTQQTS